MSYWITELNSVGSLTNERDHDQTVAHARYGMCTGPLSPQQRKKIATQPRLAALLVKQACNHVENLQNKKNAMDGIYAMHHFAHAQNSIVTGDYIAGFDGKKMAKSNKKKEQD